MLKKAQAAAHEAEESSRKQCEKTDSVLDRFVSTVLSLRQDLSMRKREDEEQQHREEMPVSVR